MKNNIAARLFLLVLCITIQGRSLAQYFNQVHDIDSTADWGYDIFLKSDSSYFIIGGAIKNGSGLFGMNISNDGNTIASKSLYKIIPLGFDIGLVGRVKKLINGNYLVPFSTTWNHPPPIDYIQSAGLAILDSLGDTVMTRLYTDTANFSEEVYDCIEMPGGVLISRSAVHIFRL